MKNINEIENFFRKWIFKIFSVTMGRHGNGKIPKSQIFQTFIDHIDFFIKRNLLI